MRAQPRHLAHRLEPRHQREVSRHETMQRLHPRLKG